MLPQHYSIFFPNWLSRNCFVHSAASILMYKGCAFQFLCAKVRMSRGESCLHHCPLLLVIPWPEAMVYIFRTTAGYLQAAEHSSGFITAHKMTQVSLWSQLCLWYTEKPLYLIVTTTTKSPYKCIHWPKQFNLFIYNAISKMQQWTSVWVLMRASVKAALNFIRCGPLFPMPIICLS